MANATVRGRFVWHELYTPNRAGSQEFYGKVAGWKVQAWDQDPEYQMFAANTGPIGAAIEDRAGTPQWLTYIGTTDVDATADAATRAGGRVQMAPTSLPNGGRYAVLADPQGATFGVHASAADAQPDTAAKNGEFSWHELASNVAPSAAFGFYAALFDWDLMTHVDMGEGMGTYLIFGRNGRQLGGMFDQSKQGRQGAYWLGYVSVPDLEASVERAKAARGSVLAGPMDVPGGDRIAQLMDPYGAFFALHTVAAQGAAAAAPKPTKKAAAKRPARAKPTKKAPAKKAQAKRAKPAARKKSTKAPAKKAARKPAKAKAKASPKKKTAKKAKRRGR